MMKRLPMHCRMKSHAVTFACLHVTEKANKKNFCFARIARLKVNYTCSLHTLIISVSAVTVVTLDEDILLLLIVILASTVNKLIFSVLERLIILLPILRNLKTSQESFSVC